MTTKLVAEHGRTLFVTMPIALTKPSRRLGFVPLQTGNISGKAFNDRKRPRNKFRYIQRCVLLSLILTSSALFLWKALSLSASDRKWLKATANTLWQQLSSGAVLSQDQNNNDITLSRVSYMLSQPYASNIIVSEKLRLLYCPVPKVASSNWKYLIRKLENIENYNDLHAAHNANSSGLRYLSDYSAAEAVRLLQPGRLFKFVFLRDPYARLLSAYMDKLRRGSGPDYRTFVAAAFSWKVAREVGGNNNETNDANLLSRPSFRSFVISISQQEPYSMDHHWQPQTCLCGLDTVPYDFIGHMESLTTDVQTVLHRIDRPLEHFPSQNELGFPPSGASSPELAAEIYTTDLMFLTRALYDRDFELGGYE